MNTFNRPIVIVESRYAPTKPFPKGECVFGAPAKGQALICFCSHCLAVEEWDLELEYNCDYARAAVRDCLLRGEAPYASHLLYTQVGILDDTVPTERQLGIEAGFQFRYTADKTVVYTDLGVSKGMQYGIEHATELSKALGHVIEYRSLEGWKKPENM